MFKNLFTMDKIKLSYQRLATLVTSGYQPFTGARRPSVFTGQFQFACAAASVLSWNSVCVCV